MADNQGWTQKTPTQEGIYYFREVTGLNGIPEPQYARVYEYEGELRTILDVGRGAKVADLSGYWKYSGPYPYAKK